MTRLCIPIGASLLLLVLAARPLWAGPRELRTVESAAEVLRALSDIPLKCIPPALMRDAKGVAIIPNVLKAGWSARLTVVGAIRCSSPWPAAASAVRWGSNQPTWS